MTYSIVPPDGPHKQLSGPCPDEGQGVTSKKVRCRLALGSAPGFTDEMSSLLRTRLRLAILVMLGGFAVHFVRNLFRLGPAYDHRTLWLLSSACEIAVILGASACSWRRSPPSRTQL